MPTFSLKSSWMLPRENQEDLQFPTVPPPLQRLWAMKSHIHFISHKYYRLQSLNVTHIAENDLSNALVSGRFLTSGFLWAGFPAGINKPHHP